MLHLHFNIVQAVKAMFEQSPARDDQARARGCLAREV